MSIKGLDNVFTDIRARGWAARTVAPNWLCRPALHNLRRVPARVFVAALLGTTLLTMALMQIVWGIAVIFWPGEVMFGEGIIYGHAARLKHGELLYQPFHLPPYTIANYTPLFYWIAGSLQAVTGYGFVPGRIISFTAGCTAAGLVAYLSARQAHDRRAGVFAALLFFALGASGLSPKSPPWFALYKEDFLGIVLALGAITTLVDGTSKRRLVIAGTFAGLAILTKQTFVAAAVAGCVWLCWHDLRKAAIFAFTVLCLVLVTAVAMEITTGAFLANTVFANAVPFRWHALVANLKQLARLQAGPLLVAALFLLRIRAWRKGTSLLALYWLATFLPLVGLARVGSNYNYWIELAAATAILASVHVWTSLCQPMARLRNLQRARALTPSLLLGAHLALVAPVAGASAFRGAAALWPNVAYANELNEVIERVRSEVGDVLAEPLDVVALADKRILVEPYFFNILHGESRWDAEPVVHRICSREVGLLILDRDLDRLEHSGYHGYAHWPAPVLAAFREVMVLNLERAGRFVYVPRQSDDFPGCHSPGAVPARG